MTDNPYADDDPDYENEAVADDSLPEPTDPSIVPPDEGDAGKAEA